MTEENGIRVTAVRIAVALERIALILAQLLPEEEATTDEPPEFVMTQDGMMKVGKAGSSR